MNWTTIAITKPASKPKWAQAALKYCCKKLSKQSRLAKTEVDEVETQIDCTKLESAVQHFLFLTQQLSFLPASLPLHQHQSMKSRLRRPVKTSAPAFPFVRLHFLGDLLRAFGMLTDMVIILKISQPIRKISNANIVNQKIILRLLTLEFWLHTWKSGLFTGE